MRDTLAEVVITFLSNTWEEGFVIKHADRLLVCRDRLLEVFRVEFSTCVAFLIAFRFGGFVVGASFKELTHQFDEMELRQRTIIPEFRVFFSGFNVLFEFCPLDVSKPELNLGGKDIELVIVFVLVDKLTCHGF